MDMIAVITMLGLAKFLGLTTLLVMVMGLFMYAVNSGGILGWWMANDMIEIAGHIITGIMAVIAEMMSSNK
jgi:hypothetical protein